MRFFVGASGEQALIFLLCTGHLRGCRAEAATISLQSQEAGINSINAIGRSENWGSESKKVCSGDTM